MLGENDETSQVSGCPHVRAPCSMTEDRRVDAAFRDRRAQVGSGEPKRLNRGRAASVSELTSGGSQHGRTAHARGRHRGSGGEAWKLRAEVELGGRVIGRSACGGERHGVGVQPKVFEDVRSDAWIGDEREHAQMIAAARALGDLVAEHPA